MKNDNHHKACYGNVTLERFYCSLCKGMRIVQDGECIECGNSVITIATYIVGMTGTEGKGYKPPEELRQKLLDLFGNKCLYCSNIFGSYVSRNGVPEKVKLAWDHLIPFSYVQSNPNTNWMPICSVCNGIKSNKIYDTMNMYLRKIRFRRLQKGYTQTWEDEP